MLVYLHTVLSMSDSKVVIVGYGSQSQEENVAKMTDQP